MKQQSKFEKLGMSSSNVNKRKHEKSKKYRTLMMGGGGGALPDLMFSFVYRFT